MSKKETNYSYSEKKKLAIFEEEFLPHIDSLYNFAYHLTLNEEAAKDLLQDTCLKAFRFINSFKKGTNAKGWLFRILKNSFINDFRKESKKPLVVDYQDFELQPAWEKEPANSLQIETVQEMLSDEISNALDSLGLDYRTVILLCDVEGFSYKEMAEILNIPIGTVRSRLHRARGLLKKALYSYAKSLGYI